MGFRCMHLPSRIVPPAMELAMQASDSSINDYVYNDGEFMAAYILVTTQNITI